jgi:DNA-binding transcriptional LysR family regulator
MRKPTLQKRTAALEWDDLRCVLAIARAGSLSGAARVLAVEHSTAFRRLNAIEKGLGVKLFERTRNGYVPTESGEITATAASVMESQALDIERRIVGADERLSGLVQLATSELFAGYLLPPALKSFTAGHPRLARKPPHETFNTSAMITKTKQVGRSSERERKSLPYPLPSSGHITQPCIVA